MKPVFFRSAADLGKWFETHHATVQELWVGYYKKGSGKPSLTWPESVDQALCVGWIDGLRKSVDEISYMIRFTPRKTRSIWSAVNIKRVKELASQGLLRPAGLEAFEARVKNRSGIYSYEQRSAELPEPYATRLEKNKAAWAFLRAQTPSYRKAVNWYVLSAKKEETRLKRLDALIDDSAHGRSISPLLAVKKPKRKGAV